MRLLERSGRFEELVQHLLERRRSLDPDSAAARELDLRRAELKDCWTCHK